MPAAGGPPDLGDALAFYALHGALDRARLADWEADLVAASGAVLDLGEHVRRLVADGKAPPDVSAGEVLLATRLTAAGRTLRALKGSGETFTARRQLLDPFDYSRSLYHWVCASVRLLDDLNAPALFELGDALRRLSQWVGGIALYARLRAVGARGGRTGRRPDVGAEALMAWGDARGASPGLVADALIGTGLEAGAPRADGVDPRAALADRLRKKRRRK